MKKIFLGLLAAVALIAVASFAAVPSSQVRQAVAAETLATPKYVALLDGGTGKSYCFSRAQHTVVVESNKCESFCVHTGGQSSTAPSGFAANCASDYTIPFGPFPVAAVVDAGNATAVYFSAPTACVSQPIEMGPDFCIAVQAVDGGAGYVGIYDLQKNSVSSNPGSL